ncbi:hypothetical protein Pint_00256 [Pistacia integerrima]|uniref:Uncharacterized protein n=1 Tax=Pistacia integerrima TaxID=434235 RepID=A0ACC0ZFW4_9ROSI|nr:hypothetical protein Pint_00256 [Pistacia integerrima]
MNMKKLAIPKLVYICFLSIPLLLFIFLSKHPILFYTYEFIFVAKSKRDAVFVMFNVIIITIFLGSSKPSAMDFDWFFNPSPIVHETYYDDSYDDDDDDDCHGHDGYDEDNDDDLGTEDVESEDEIDNDLERKIEEFIAKVNSKWREESIAEKLLYIESATLPN